MTNAPDWMQLAPAQQHPITPPPDLRAQWRKEAPIYRDCGVGREKWLMDRATQWGWDQRGAINEAMLQARADQELEACCEWFADARNHGFGDDYAKIISAKLRAARRPKPLSLKELKEQGLAAAARFYAKGHEDCTEQEVRDDYDALCRALEALPE